MARLRDGGKGGRAEAEEGKGCMAAEEKGGREEVMDEYEGSWTMDSMGGERKETWAVLELRTG